MFSSELASALSAEYVNHAVAGTSARFSGNSGLDRLMLRVLAKK
jgi:hypothetical protein